MKNIRVWAATPEAKAKLEAAGGKIEQKEKAPCPAMKRAREQAERVTRELAEEKAEKRIKPPSAEKIN
ncbi:MAG: uL15 family ribosomal protein [Treponema sp.]|jgi:hypothetical protein|nr:uL15 family ribosomal protein [Treponema sp.]